MQTSSARKFQSLSGFQVRCNLTLCPEFLPCSICFNPYRVFKFVATQGPARGLGGQRTRFQSLSGFQVRCNSQRRAGSRSRPASFNPYRVFKFVATAVRSRAQDRQKCFNPYRVFKFVATQSGILPRDLALWVSIPIGFSSSLQHRHSAESRLDYQGFNPYRVFKFVATYPPPVPPICWT